jgi:hypothetical protein
VRAEPEQRFAAIQAEGQIGGSLKRFPVILDHPVIQYDRDAP